MNYLNRQLANMQKALSAGALFEDVAALKIYPQRRFARIVSENLPNQGSYLEVGSGGSIAVHELSKLGFDCQGLDIDPAAENYFKFIRDIYNSKARFILGDAFHLPFPDGSIDVVCSVGMIEHFSASEQAVLVREMWRVTKGHLFLAIPNYDPSSVFHYLLVSGEEEHHECDLNALAVELKSEKSWMDGRGVFTTLEMALKNRSYFEFLTRRYPDLARENFFAKDIPHLIACEDALTPQERLKHGFVKWICLHKNSG